MEVVWRAEYAGKGGGRGRVAGTETRSPIWRLLYMSLGNLGQKDYRKSTMDTLERQV